MNPDNISGVLQHSLRRQIIAILHGNGDIDRERLTAILATAEAENQSDSQQVRRRIRLELHHNHLPRLADAGLIKYDEETVIETPRLETVAQLFPLFDEGTPRAEM